MIVATSENTGAGCEDSPRERREQSVRQNGAPNRNNRFLHNDTNEKVADDLDHCCCF